MQPRERVAPGARVAARDHRPAAERARPHLDPVLVVEHRLAVVRRGRQRRIPREARLGVARLRPEILRRRGRRVIVANRDRDRGHRGGRCRGCKCESRSSAPARWSRRARRRSCVVLSSVVKVIVSVGLARQTKTAISDCGGPLSAPPSSVTEQAARPSSTHQTQQMPESRVISIIESRRPRLTAAGASVMLATGRGSSSTNFRSMMRPISVPCRVSP